MKHYTNQLKYLIFIPIVLVGCANPKAYINDPQRRYVNKDDNPIINRDALEICSIYETPKELIERIALLECSLYDKRAIFIESKQSRTCTLSKPLSHSYWCMEIADTPIYEQYLEQWKSSNIEPSRTRKLAKKQTDAHKQVMAYAKSQDIIEMNQQNKWLQQQLIDYTKNKQQVQESIPNMPDLGIIAEIYKNTIDDFIKNQKVGAKNKEEAQKSYLHLMHAYETILRPQD